MLIFAKNEMYNFIFLLCHYYCSSYFLPINFFSFHPTVLICSTLCYHSCILGFTFSASCSGFSGLLYRRRNLTHGMCPPLQLSESMVTWTMMLNDDPFQNRALCTWTKIDMASVCIFGFLNKKPHHKHFQFRLSSFK